ncbi:secretogranin-1 [Mesocricetus auratus]|uniref:Secretogranin-1 n=1 Tax=Mesocricetus auratus TaxID=10036 RepID=A0A1U7Q9I1_MESAU|nr:secretogranin-1 [Mesocricetus auratus]
MQTAVLLGLLGAAALSAVGSAPVDNRNPNEEMVTHCIIEVLSSALSKSSVPTVTSQCRQVLKKSGKEIKGEEKDENENTKFEVRLLRDPADASLAHGSSSREETAAPVEDTQGQTKVDKEKWTEGGGHSRERMDETQESLHPSNQQMSKEAKIHHSEEIGREEREEGEGKNHPKGEHREDAGEEKDLETPGEKQSTLSNKRNDPMAKKKEESVARTDTHPMGLHEKTHSREQGSQESEEEARRQETPRQELSDHDQSEEESEEDEEDMASSEVAKRRPRHHHGRSRPNKPSQEGHPALEERRHTPEESEEAAVATASLGEKRGHSPTHYRASQEELEYGEEMRNYPGSQVPKSLRRPQYGGRGSEEDRVLRPQSEESQEKEYRRSHPNSERESMANRHSEDTEEERGYEGTKGHQHRGREGVPGAFSALGAREEKGLLDEGHYPIQEGPIDKPKRYPQSKWQGQEENYLNYGEEGDQGKWWQQEEALLDPEESREEVGFPDRQYAPYPITEKRKRLGVLFNPYFDPLQWKDSDFEKKDNPDDNFLEGEGEDGNGLTLTEKSFFPEYNYDWWEKRPYSEDVNWGYEKRGFARDPHPDMKRQYDGVAELDQLLHYRKKSDEFPDFYDSEEQVGPRQEADDEKGRADQRVMTEEEKKELENLTAMDLELQKIAEKFSQRG